MNKFLKGLLIVLFAAVVGAVAGLSMWGVTKATGVLDAYGNAVSELNQKISPEAAAAAAEKKPEEKVEIGESLKKKGQEKPGVLY